LTDLAGLEPVDLYGSLGLDTVGGHPSSQRQVQITLIEQQHARRHDIDAA
jgi:hypothetical protein